MKSLKRFFFLLIFCLILVSLFEVRNVYALSIKEKEEKIYSNVSIDDDFSDERIIVVLNKEASFKVKNYDEKDFPNCKNVSDLTEYDTKYIKNKINKGYSKKDITNSKSKMTDYSNFHRILSIELESKSKENVLKYIDKFMERDDVLYAGPDYPLSSTSTNNEVVFEDNSEIYDKINIPEAWEFTTGSSDVLVGVLDTGIDGDHPDLENSIVNDLCKDFTPGNFDGNNDTSLEDTDGHGTHIAGIIGAIGNNDIGIKGVCWNVGLVSLKISTNGLDAYTSYVLNAINYAKENNIHILNLSYVWRTLLGDLYDVSLESVIASYNGLVICAAGNDNRDITDANDLFPVCYATRDNLISVGSTDKVDSKALESNYGTNNVDIYAPGAIVNSTYPVDLITDLYDGSGYFISGGTSMAAPFVAGTAALLLSIRPDLTFSQLKEIIINSSDSISFLIENSNSSSNTGIEQSQIQYPAKRLNVQAAIKYLFDNYETNSYDISTNDITINGTLNTNETNYFNNNFLLKLSVSTLREYVFKITANNSVNVKLYNTDLDEVNIETTETDSNLTHLFTLSSEFDYYYIRISSDVINSNISVILDIHSHIKENHIYCEICDNYILEHEYNYSYTWKNYLTHYSFCNCGEKVSQPHVVSSSSTATGGYAKCLLCKGNAQVGFVEINSLMTDVTHRTLNGSVILSNGIIILVDADIVDYFDGKLSFINIQDEIF